MVDLGVKYYRVNILWKYAQSLFICCERIECNEEFIPKHFKLASIKAYRIVDKVTFSVTRRGYEGPYRILIYNIWNDVGAFTNCSRCSSTQSEEKALIIKRKAPYWPVRFVRIVFNQLPRKRRSLQLTTEEKLAYSTLWDLISPSILMQTFVMMHAFHASLLLWTKSSYRKFLVNTFYQITQKVNSSNYKKNN